MPRKDLVARREYAKKYRERPDIKVKLRAYWHSYYAVPENAERARRTKYKFGGMPEPTRPRPERCECCNRPPEKKRTLHLDHDHKTGAFRGWLCHHCNTGIGLLGDDALGVRFALAYLSLNG